MTHRGPFQPLPVCDSVIPGRLPEQAGRTPRSAGRLCRAPRSSRARRSGPALARRHAQALDRCGAVEGLSAAASRERLADSRALEQGGIQSSGTPGSAGVTQERYKPGVRRGRHSDSAAQRPGRGGVRAPPASRGLSHTHRQCLRSRARPSAESQPRCCCTASEYGCHCERIHSAAAETDTNGKNRSLVTRSLRWQHQNITFLMSQ